MSNPAIAGSKFQSGTKGAFGFIGNRNAIRQVRRHPLVGPVARRYSPRVEHEDIGWVDLNRSLIDSLEPVPMLFEFQGFQLDREPAEPGRRRCGDSPRGLQKSL